MLKVGGGLGTGIDNDVPHRPAGAADEFHLRSRCSLVVHSPKRTFAIVVGELDLNTPHPQSVPRRFLCVEQVCEKPPLVLNRRRLDDECAAQFRRSVDHFSVPAPMWTLRGESAGAKRAIARRPSCSAAIRTSRASRGENLMYSPAITP